MVRGDWIPNGTKLLIISIYCPQDLSEKKMLWDYLSHVIAQWARKRTLKSDLADLDLIIDKGCGDVEIVNKRANVVRSLQELENLQSLEAAKNQRLNGQSRAMRILSSNSSFIALILKTRDANMVKDFRPISLIGSMYKIIAKILANRLFLVLGNLVNEVQSAFIMRGGIGKSRWSFILNEIVQWCQSKKKQSLVFKVDFEKAFDSVRWDYLDDILRRGSVIVNGSPTEEFQFHKDLKQGDPLSLFLFILVMETLHISFQRIVDAGMFKGLRLNMSKSKLMGIYVDANKVAQAAIKIGCVTLKTPFTFWFKSRWHMSESSIWEMKRSKQWASVY
ncbi:RNA-directed DNA polymerase, eukaryota, reverse transcriptase zinc-binding domain protein [Tanacetum coccineum]